jgi:hypothetical protein
MPELVEKQNQSFWEFPELPFDVGQRIKALIDFYLRSNPETGKVDTSETFVYPNNATPRLLLPLLDYLQRVTNSNTILLTEMPAFSGYAQMMLELERWQERLNFYSATTQGLFADGPDICAGDSSNAVSLELATNVVNPLLLGWYPNAQEPFSLQPGVFSQQTERAVPDAYYPYALANQIAVSLKAQSEMWEDYKAAVRESVADAIEATGLALDKAAGALKFGIGLLPVAVALGVGFAVFSRLKK